LASAILKREFESFINAESFAAALCYHDETTKQLAFDFCQLARRQLNLNFDFEMSGWDLNLVTDLQSTPQAGHALVVADMIVVAAGEGFGLDEAQKLWIEKWLLERKNSGLLVLVHPGSAAVSEDSFLAPLAHRVKLDFLQLPASAVVPVEPKPKPETAVPVVTLDTAALNRFRPTHWGINE
jgi:hypothetical protein